MKRLGVALLIILAPAALAAQSPSASGFRLTTGDFWLNLHQFLYVLGRAQANMPDASRRAVADAVGDQARALAAMTERERATWTSAVEAYAAGPSRGDAVFDRPLIAIGNALASARDAATLDGVALDPAVRAILERAAPVYRRAWWPAHRAANETWAAGLTALLARHGERVRAFVTRAYGISWPDDGYPVRVAAYTNWAGAFSTSGPLILISSHDPGNSGMASLESAVHEAMHQWDGEVSALLRKAAAAQDSRGPRLLSHAMLFFTAGEAVRSVTPGYVTYGERGIWEGSMGAFKPALEKAWLPWLRGEGTRDQAIAELVRIAGEPR